MKRSEYKLNSAQIIENSIKSHIFQYGPLTAMDIQKRMGLKRQTTYNYLKILEKKKSIITHQKTHPDQPNVKITYYSYKIKKQPVKYSVNLRKMYEKKTLDEVRELFNEQIDFTIASLLASKVYLNTISDQELEEYIDKSVIGPGMDNLSLSDQEFEELGEELNKVLSSLWNKWKEIEIEEGKNEDRNLFIIGGFHKFNY